MNCRLGELVVAGSLLVCGWTDVRAASWITEMACDSVSIQGVFYPRVTFSVQNQSPRYYVDLIVARPPTPPDPQDSCWIVSAMGSGLWDSTLDPSSGMVLWGTEIGNGLLPGQSQSGFQLVFARAHSCCYQLRFVGFYPEAVAVENVCFQCDAPVPVIKRSWGALKVRYR